MSIADKLTLLAGTKEALRIKLGISTSIPFGQYADIVRGAWTPTELFDSGVKGAWYDPSDLSTLFQDVAGTVPVTSNGDPIGKILDKSGNGNHATQSVSTKRPVYRTNGSLHWFEMDGVDDFIDIPINLNDKLATMFVSYIDLAAQNAFLLADSGAVNPWGFTGSLGDMSTDISATGTATKIIKSNIHDTMPATRDAFYKMALEANAISVSTVFSKDNAQYQDWQSSYRYGIYSGAAIGAFKKTTGYIVILSAPKTVRMLKYLASKSGVSA